MTTTDKEYQEKNAILLKWLNSINAIVSEMNSSEYNFDDFFTNNISDISFQLERISEEINEVIDSSELNETLRIKYIFEWEQLTKRIDKIESFLKTKFDF